MALKSISEGLAFRQIVLETKTAAFDTKADALDVSGFNGVCFFISHPTAAAVVNAKVVHSDDGVTWADASSDEVVPNMYVDGNTLKLPAGVLTGKVGYIGIKQYVALDVTGSGLAGVMNVVGVLGEAALFPTM